MSARLGELLRRRVRGLQHRRRLRAGCAEIREHRQVERLRQRVDGGRAVREARRDHAGARDGAQHCAHLGGIRLLLERATGRGTPRCARRSAARRRRDPSAHRGSRPDRWCECAPGAGSPGQNEFPESAPGWRRRRSCSSRQQNVPSKQHGESVGPEKWRSVPGAWARCSVT